MKKVCAFTIVAKNYIGLAQILGNSIRKTSPEIDFKIIVADEFEQGFQNLPNNLIIAKECLNKDTIIWNRMTFQYDLTQLCTAVKPGCILYFFRQGYDQIIYFDPDIYVFSSLNQIIDSLNEYQIVLTPQIAGIHIEYKGEHPEWAMNCNGIFNLGFGGFRNTPKVIKLLQWWDKRLETECFSDRTVGNFTDQKWMDWVPGFFSGREFSSLTNLGMNLAPWNFFERKVFKEQGEYYVTFRENDMPPRKDKLVFIHFAGYDYKALKRGEIRRKRIEDLNEYEDLLGPLEEYRDQIVKNAELFDSFISQKYSYGSYTNGDMIEPFHRRVYHGLVLEEYDFFNPFDTGKGTFYDQLKGKKMFDKSGLTKKSRQDIENISSKRRLIEKIFSFLYRAGGYRRYVLFVRALIDYCRPEYHTFLINKNKIK